jgi:hypothetical protein
LVIPEKIQPLPPPPSQRKFWGREEKFVSDNSKCIRTIRRESTSNFLCGEGMDVFWNGPIKLGAFEHIAAYWNN